jgi:hypothetical protein
MSWTNWQPLVPSVVRRAPSTLLGVYEFALDGQRHPYPYGWSSTIYYGHTKRALQKRLGEHVAGNGNPTVSELLRQGVPVKVRWWTTSMDPSIIECRLLARFEEEFGAIPVANANRCRR